METKERLNLYIPRRLKRRLKTLSEDKGISMNDLIIRAISDSLDRTDMINSAPDIVLDRLGQVLNSQMAVVTKLEHVSKQLDEMKDED